MKVMELARFGIENLKIVETELPDPGPGQVLVKFGGASINYRDYQIVTGEFAPNQPLPIIPGSDGAGEVVGVGDSVTRFTQGDRVAPLFFPNWLAGEAVGDVRSISSGLEAPGVLREYGVYDQDQVGRIAPHLTDEEAACFPCAGLTAWTCLVPLSKIQAGDTVLVQGTGGVALFGLQFAKALGASVIITSGSDAKLEQAGALGADHCINYRSTPGWGDLARDLTDGRGVDSVIEIGGTGTLPQSIAALRRGGHINIVGYLAGIEIGLTVFHLIERNAHLHGISVGNAEGFIEMMNFVSEHNLVPVIHKSYAFEDTAAAMTDIVAGDHFGKLVVRIQPE
jgi:NADPH:quinone reductase-like Zn-dependent oxidoreductase